MPLPLMSWLAIGRNTTQLVDILLATLFRMVIFDILVRCMSANYEQALQMSCDDILKRNKSAPWTWLKVF